MIKTGIWLAVSLVILLSGCLPQQQDPEEEILQNDPEAEQETSIVPSHQLDDENYRIIIPYEVSEARGVISNQVANRLDIDELEEGLKRHSKDVFDPEDYYFQEGQYLSESTVFELIDELNPEIGEDLDPDEERELREDNPRYLSHILEHNFLERRDDDSVELAGISIGIAMKSVYRFQVDGIDYQEEISESEMLAQGEQIAQEILDHIRSIEGLENIPVMLAIYREAEQSSPIPGNFSVRTIVDGGGNSIGDWESLGEEYILFPSDEGREKYFDDHEVVSSFGQEIAEFFPNYVGIIGEGFYVDEELQRLSIEIPIEFYGKSEVIGFTQFTYTLVQEMFENYYELEIKVTSSDQIESLIYRSPEAESPTVHILH
jgi:protein involved in sex pheromone biosynthesis